MVAFGFETPTCTIDRDPVWAHSPEAQRGAPDRSWLVASSAWPTTIVGAAISIMGAAALLAIWHDPGTIAAIRGSGGLSEVFSLPLTMVLPGALLGTVGGVAGAVARRLRVA